MANGWSRGVLALAVTAWLGGSAYGGGDPLPFSIEDFFIPGTQPRTNPPANSPSAIVDDLAVVNNDCDTCHEDSATPTYPVTYWRHSMMGQATRDPIFLACLDIANDDVPFSGDLCIRCHSPLAWLSGRSLNPDNGFPDARNFTDANNDFEGVACTVCHRMVNPVTSTAEPNVDAGELQVLQQNGLLPSFPTQVQDGSYIVDRQDRRRGPYTITHAAHNPTYYSPYFLSSSLCGTCHDVSNPVYLRQEDGAYIPSESHHQHETLSKFDMFPIERTFSEWSKSEFAKHAINIPRFGGNNPNVATCQDCHMAKMAGVGCTGGDERPDNPKHEFNGANTWVLNAIKSLDTGDTSGLTDAGINDAYNRTKTMMENASDLKLWQTGSTLNARIINMSGHKLPTGYPEGRRMWINVKFYDGKKQLIEERGAYSGNNTTQSVTHDTTIIEAELGYTDTIANLFGLPTNHEHPEDTSTHSFHFVVNNIYQKDNRIPPRGFTNSGFASIQAAPVGQQYADGQYWLDSQFAIPDGAVNVQVRVFHQATTPEYIQFLKDNNPFKRSDEYNRGFLAWSQWTQQDRSAPLEIDFKELDLSDGGQPSRAYVDDTATGANDGTTWANAYTNLQSALTANPPASEIWVAQGMYEPGNTRESSFRIPDGVTVYGGFAGNEATLADRAGLYHQTILSGDIGTPGDESDNCFHVVDFNPTQAISIATLDGFTITGGNADDLNPNAEGGGVFAHAADGFLSVRNCLLLGNQASRGAAVSVDHCTLQMADCVISGNGTSAITGTLDGGALYCSASSQASLIGCSISRNAAISGGGVEVTPYSSVLLANCILYNNSDNLGTDQDAQIYTPIPGDTYALTVNYSLVEGWDGTLGGTGNADEDPQFHNSLGQDGIAGTLDDDLTLNPCAPAIDAGWSAAIPAGLNDDLDGNPRYYDDPRTDDTGGGGSPIVDIGAYEFAKSSCKGDVNYDGVVDINDLSITIMDWGVSATCVVGDTNNDHIVNIDDLTDVILNWGPCPPIV